MSNLFSDAVGGVAGWWTNTFGANAGQQEQGAALDAQLAAINNNTYAPGGTTYNSIKATQGQAAADAAWAKVQADQSNQEQQTASDNADVTAAAQAGAQQGLDNVKGGINHFFESFFGLIPMSVWLIGAVALFWWLGGFVWLKGIIARKAKK